MNEVHRSTAVYLHFLDRELGEAVGLSASGADLIRYTRTLLLMTDGFAYTGLSAVWENPKLGPRANLDLEAAFNLNLLRLVSHKQTLVEFQDSRQTAYEHDRHRYPRYFGGDNSALSWSAPSVLKASGSTKPLVADLSTWAVRLAASADGGTVTYTAVGVPVLAALGQREDQAVTFSLFREHLSGLRRPEVAERIIRRQISTAFTQDQMLLLSGDVPTGIYGLVGFDDLGRSFPTHDIPILEEILALTGLSAVVDAKEGWRVESWTEVIGLRRSPLLADAFSVMPTLLGAWGRHEQSRPLPTGQDAEYFYGAAQVRDRITRGLRLAVRYGQRLRPIEETAGAHEVLSRLVAFAMRLPQALRKDDEALAEALEAALGRGRVQDDVILVATVTDTESEALHQALTAAGYLSQPEYGAINTYRVYRGSGGTVYHVRSSMGSGGQGGSQATVADALRETAAHSVVAVGIAFGMDEIAQPIGQVLVSQQLSSYELQRVGQGGDGAAVVVRRGSRQECSPRLISRFRDARLSDIGISVKVGEMLSGEKLVDNSSFKAELLSSYPEAIGGEMEGAGVQAASGRAGVEWVIIKAVCDYAENKSQDKKSRQALAAGMAAKALVHVLDQGGLRRVQTR